MKLQTIFRRAGAILIGTSLAVGLLITSAGAAVASGVAAQLSPNFTVLVDGESRTFYNVAGVEVHPILYNGTTYLPVRAMSELIGKNVNWDQSTYTVSLGGTRTTPPTVGTPDLYAVTRDVTVRLSPDITVLMDGVQRQFADANGNTVYPLLYDGSVYLPIRAIGNLMGMSVGWNGSTQTVSLNGSTAGEGSLVTDADSFGPTDPNTGNTGTTTPTYPDTGSGSTGTGITADQARQIALNHAGLSASQVAFVRSHLDWEHGRQVYDVEFYSTSNYTEYDYEIDATNGTILSYDYDAEYWNRPSYPSYPNTGSGGTSAAISLEEAKQIALARVPGATNIRIHLEWDDGRLQYEGSIYYGYWEYEFSMDANTGTIWEWERDHIYD